MYQKIGDGFRSVFKQHAGWAHMILFGNYYFSPIFSLKSHF